MVVVLVEFTNAQTSIAQAAWMVVVEVTRAFMYLIIAEGTCRFLANKPQKSGSEPNFDVKLLSAEGEIVLNWNLTHYCPEMAFAISCNSLILLTNLVF
jgi:hypothetical protein